VSAVRQASPDPLRADVLRLLEDVRRPADPPLPPGASDTQIERLASLLGFAVPSTLADWLATCNGPRRTSQVLFGFETPSPFLDLAHKLELFPTWRPRRWVPVAGDGCGNYYVLDASREHLAADGVFFIETIHDPNSLAYIVASDVWHFLRFLLEEELRDDERFDDEFFRLQERDWRRAYDEALARVSWPWEESYVLAHDPVLGDAPDRLLPWRQE
jgi:hypothetical protein